MKIWEFLWICIGRAMIFIKITLEFFALIGILFEKSSKLLSILKTLYNLLKYYKIVAKENWGRILKTVLWEICAKTKIMDGLLHT